MTSVTPNKEGAEAEGSTVAASYERVSTRTQGQTGFSLGAQAKDTAQYAAEVGWSLPDHLRFRDGEDRDASGADLDLPGLTAMLDAARRHEFEVLIVPAVDRLARDMYKAYAIEHELTKLKVRTVYLSTPVEDSPEGQLFLDIQRSFAKFERAKTSLRSNRGRREKVERGQVVGNGPAPYGYRYIRVGSPRPRVVGLEIDALTPSVVQRIFREALHRSALDIAQGLQRDGITPPPGYNRRDPARRWATDVVLRILTHPAYAGRMIYGAGDGRTRAERFLGSEDVGIPVPAIVDRGLWEDVQRALQRRRAARRGRAEEDSWLLRGLLRCGHCGGILSATWNSKGLTAGDRAAGVTTRQRYRRYVCLRSSRTFSERNGIALCPMRDVRAEDLEVAVWDMVRAALMDPDRLKEGLQAAQNEHEQAVRQRKQRLESVDRQIARQRSLIERLLDEILETPKGSHSYRGLIERQRVAEDSLRRLDAEHAGLDREPDVGLTSAAAEELAEFGREIAAGLSGATVSERRWVLEQLRLTGSVQMDHNGQPMGRKGHRFSLELDARIRVRASHSSRWSLTSPADCMNA